MSRLERMRDAMRGTSLVSEARPFTLGPREAKEAVLLLHGFTGIPKELSTLGSILADSGYFVTAARYPGHGTGRADFLTTRAEDWLRRAFDAHLELAAGYEKVHVLGHSMGGIIATIVAECFGAAKLVLLAPAFLFSHAGFDLAPFVAPLAPVIKRNRPLPKEEKDRVRRRLFAEYWADDLVAGAVQLKRIQRLAKTALPRLGSRILVLAGSGDTVVLPAVGSYIERMARRAASVDSRVLDGAGHLFPFDASAAETASIVRDWMGRPGSEG